MRSRGNPSRGRYDLHATDQAGATIGEAGVTSTHSQLLDAATAFVKCPLHYKSLVHVDQCGYARHLTRREEEFVDAVASKLGYEVVDA